MTDIGCFRITKPEDITVLEDLIEKFHRKVPTLRYSMAWSMGTLQAAIADRNSYVLIAGNGDGYKGYLWAHANPSGEMLIIQMFSQTPETGRALTDGLMFHSQRTGIARWDAVVELRPEERSVVIQSLKRIGLLCRRHGFGPFAIFLSKNVGGPGH